MQPGSLSYGGSDDAISDCVGKKGSPRRRFWLIAAGEAMLGVNEIVIASAAIQGLKALISAPGSPRHFVPTLTS